MDEIRNQDLEELMHSSAGSLTFQYQKELIYNKLLPYNDELEVESQALLAEIKANLGRAVMLRELQPGCSLWATRLQKFIQLYGMKFSKEDHILFIKLMYELVLIPNLEPFLVNKFSFTLILLLKKKGLISPEELELPWKPLYEMIYIRKSSDALMRKLRYYAYLGATLNLLLHNVKAYFPLNATQEILDELKPFLCPLDGVTMPTTVEALGRFLPVQLSPKNHSFGHKLWFDEFMTLWEVCHNAPQWESDMMWLMARLAIHNIGYIDWEPHLPLMFTRFARCLNLPVSYNKMQSNKHHKIETSSIAIWIVAVLGGGSSGQMYLEKFLKTIETYFHPANFGRWMEKLKELLIKLPYHFITRVHKERYAKPTWENTVPEEYKLTDNDIDAFVKSMIPVAMTAMFNKLSVDEACEALQHLATMRPNLVIPDVLERMYSTLDSLTEPHKLKASMICMVAIARPMVQGPRNINKDYVYSEGPTHVLPLLFSFLPGIDPNDAQKCFATFRLISAYATLIPIVDSSRSSAEMDEEERIICEATSRFEDFVIQFLDRVFLFIDSSSLQFVRLENRTGDGKSKSEIVTEAGLGLVCTILLIQTSDKIFQSALHKLRLFVTERILETEVAGQLAAVLCRVFSRVNGKETLRALLPVLSQTILDITEEGEEIFKEENLDNRLLHSILLLSAVVDTTGDNLLPHVNTLTNVLDRLLLLKSREGHILSCKLLKTVLLSFSTMTSCKFSSIERDYNDPDYPYVRDWGQAMDIDSINIKWYIPGKEELATLKEIFFKYLTPEINRLQRYCEDWTTLTRDELFTSLNVVNSIIGSCESVLPVWTEEPLSLVKSCLEWVPFLPTLGFKETITMPDGSNVRRYIVGIMTDVQRVLLKNVEDDTKSLSLLIHIWSSLLLGRNLKRKAHEARRKSFQVAKRMIEDKLVRNKSYLGPIILECADIQQGTRLQSQSFTLTETHKNIMLQLFTLATSRYPHVRTNAQAILSNGLQHFPYSYMFIIPKIVETLKVDPEEHHDAYKGVLYLLFGAHGESIIIKRDWKMLRSLWPTMVLSKTTEKLSVIRLKNNLVEYVNKHFSATTITIEIPESCLTAAAALWETSPQPTLPQPNEDEIKNGLNTLEEIGRSNLETYYGLMNDLLRAILEENLHWRQRLMAMNFICDIVHPDHIYPPKVVRYFLEALIHDSLQERKIAIKTVIFMLMQQKRKHPKITIDIPTIRQANQSKGDQDGKLIPGHRPDNDWLQYNYDSRPLTAEQWDEPRFIHQSYIGYYAWPSELEVYAPSSQQPCLDPNVRVLTEHEKEVDAFFNNAQNIEKLIKFFSLEEKKGKDRFNAYKYLLFKSIFRNHGDVFLKQFLPHLHKLVTDKQESSQRCAAEIIAGIIRGAKHWPFQMTCNLWDSLLPIIRLALANLTVETMGDWGICFATSQRNRDPNRHYWFLECLMEEPRLGESESSFVECGRLYTLQGALKQQPWRVTQLLKRLLVRLEDRLFMSPFENVREHLGLILVTVFAADLRFPQSSGETITPRAQNFIERVIPQLQFLVDEGAAIFSNEERALSEKVANVKFDDSTTSTKINTEQREAAIRLLKTVCNWIVDTLLRSQHGTLPGFYQIFPIICQFENYEADEELTKMCSSTLAILAQAFTLPCDIPVVLDAMTKLSRNLSWSARFSCLEFLQVLVFHNMSIFLSNLTWVNCIRDIVLYLLEDQRLEVREKASHVLGGLLHCTFIPEQDNLLKEFQKKAKTKLHRKNHSNCNRSEVGKDNTDAIRIRHAGVLGLCAFIKAHPYDIPKYVPSIFEYLGLHMNDPQPIPTTIRKTLYDFKRTHYDGWTGMNGHVQQFTKEQLAVMEDLTVPPSYYV